MKELTLSQQLQQFKSLVAQGKIPKTDVERAVYLINVGANDIFFAPTDQIQAVFYVAQMIEGYLEFMKALYQEGARKFIVNNVAPVGCSPATRAFSGQTGANATCEQGPNLLAQAYNTAVGAALKGLQFIGDATGLGKSKVVLFDQYQFALDLFQRNSKSDPASLNACCGAPPPINGLVQCGRKSTINNVTLTATLCNNIDSQIFWDYVHPTQKQNQKIATEMWKGGIYTSPADGAKILLET